MTPSLRAPRAVPGGPFGRLGAFVVRHHRAVIVAWAVLLLAAVPFAPRAAGVLRAGGFTLDDLPSAEARHLLEQQLGVAPSGVVVVLHSDTAKAGTPVFETAAAAAIADLVDAPHVRGVVTHTLRPAQVSADRRTAYDILFLDLAPDDSPDALPVLEQRVHRPAGLEVQLAGGPAFYGDVQKVSESDLRRSELISLPLAAIALLVVFGSVVAAAIPLAVGGAAVLVAL